VPVRGGTCRGAAEPPAGRLVGDGFGSWSDIICGIGWVTLRAGTLEAANMSFGVRITKNGTADDGKCGRSNRDPLHNAICRSVTAGLPYVVAAGNTDRNVADYVPASYDEVITVSALADYNGLPGGGAPRTCYEGGPDDTFARFSNFGTDVDVGAPGVCIKST